MYIIIIICSIRYRIRFCAFIRNIILYVYLYSCTYIVNNNNQHHSVTNNKVKYSLSHTHIHIEINCVAFEIKYAAFGLVWFRMNSSFLLVRFVRLILFICSGAIKNFFLLLAIMHTYRSVSSRLWSIFRARYM